MKTMTYFLVIIYGFFIYYVIANKSDTDKTWRNIYSGDELLKKYYKPSKGKN